MKMKRGSPPRMRGKLNTNLLLRSCVRITPADAGKTIKRCPDRAIARDHPRGCGENGRAHRMSNCSTGSPPRMRGKLHKETIWAAAQRITPADAGKTCFSVAGAEPQRDHPRGCGENAQPRYSERWETGSPPRMRGKQKILFA